MTHQTNGASLEDCHTNFFALTDLCGIKWRKLVHGESSSPVTPGPGGGGGYTPGGGGGGPAPASAEPLEDPVLSSYAKCLAGDILCVWRRVGSPQPNSGGGGGGGGGLFDSIGLPQVTSVPPLSLSAAKELWIFWYGEEPDLSNLVTPELFSSEGEQGSWESGLSYECRSLLFKALHNLIERCLLSREFVRLGKWFVQPYDGTEKSSEKSSHLSFRFAFFVHGESTVCASVDVRVHPPVRYLTRGHLVAAQQQVAASVAAAQAAGGGHAGHAGAAVGPAASGVQVILAPFGLAGTLTGQVFKAVDTAAHRLLEDWRHFYPLHTPDTVDIPPVVEVLVGGVKMRYPSCYVLVTEMDSPAPLSSSPSPLPPLLLTSSSGGDPTSPTSPGVTVSVVPHHTHHPASMVHPPPPAITLPETAWQECTLEIVGPASSAGGPASGPGAPHAGTPPPSAAAAASSQQQQGPGSWPFTDPTLKKPCVCAKSHHHPSSSTPHHPGGGGCGDSSVPPISPPSIGPSPLPGQPPSVPPCDSTMPVLSPQHPLKAPTPGGAGGLDDKSHIGGARTPSSVSNNVFSPYTGPLGAPPSVEGGAGTPGGGVTIKTEPADSGSGGGGGSQSNANNSSGQNTGGANSSTTTSGGQQTGSNSNNTTSLVHVPLKRPVLQSRDYEECLAEDDAMPSTLLYDYSTLDAWLDHPVKRFKTSDTRSELPVTARPPGAPLYPPSSSSPSPNSGFGIKQEPQQGGLHPGSGQMDSSDPYNFDDEGGGGNINNNNSSGGTGTTLGMDGFKRGPGPPGPESLQIKEEDVKNSSNNLFTNEGLVASYKDLENMFENSDDNGSSDEATLQVPTPPGSNKPASGCEDSGHTPGSGGTGTTLLVRPPRGSGGAGVNIRPEELSKMFPTPPSLENHPMASPSGGHLGDTPTHEASMLVDYHHLSPFGGSGGGGGGKIKSEIYPNMGSPPEELIEDTSYVFRPSTMARMVGSSKYAPLTNLPSQSLPPLVLSPTLLVYKPTYVSSQSQSASSYNSNNTSPTTMSSQHQHQQGPAAASANHSNTVDIKPNMLPNPPTPSSRGGMTPTPTPLRSPYPPASPMMWANAGYRGARTPCPPPPPYSPATPSSTYGGANVKSEPPATSLPPNGGRPPEASSLVVNILLGDTLLNIFRDHNFDSCTLCVCSTDPKCVGNIKGADAGVYLPPSGGGSMVGPATLSSPSPGMSPSPYNSSAGGGNSFHNNNNNMMGGLQMEEDAIRCSCGFSAVVNRRLSHRSGLFLEDELEITGISEELPDKDENPVSAGAGAAGVIDLMREQCGALHSSANSLLRATRSLRSASGTTGPGSHPAFNVLELADTNQVTHIALDQGRLAQLTQDSNSGALCKVEEMAAKQQQQQQQTDDEYDLKSKTQIQRLVNTNKITLCVALV
uniref:Mediator of RNA polymerase II transcription subunit 13 n=1 Tax=Cacopsylla melanoneura TaxID=428564 RepID=A0A8D9A536_9HEMI